MSRKRKAITEEEIDEIVAAQADEDSAWEEPVQIRKAERIDFEEATFAEVKREIKTK